MCKDAQREQIAAFIKSKCSYDDTEKTSIISLSVQFYNNYSKHKRVYSVARRMINTLRRIAATRYDVCRTSVCRSSIVIFVFKFSVQPNEFNS